MSSQRPLHILILSDRDWTHPQGGGTGTNLFGQVSRWIAWGHRVTVIACSYPGAAPVERLGPLTIHRMGGRSTVFPRVIWKQWRGLVPDPDVVVEVINGVTFLTPLWLRDVPRVSLVHHIHHDHYLEEMGPKGRLDALEATPGALLDIAGDGDYRDGLEAEIAARGLGDRVRMHGYVSEEKKLELLQRSWVHLTASSAEGWCLTVMEAAACETPSVALDVGGLPESVEDGRTGVLARDSEELGGHTRRLVEDRERRERMGRAARERALGFTWERTARQSL